MSPAGRPRTRKNGILVSDLPTLKARLSPKAKALVLALAELRECPAYALLEEAFWEHWERLPREQREAAERLAKKTEKKMKPGKT